MKAIPLLALFFVLLSCNTEDPVTTPATLADQSFELNESSFGVVSSWNFDESLDIKLSGSMLSFSYVGADETDFIDMVIDIDKITDNKVSPDKLKLTSLDLGPTSSQCPNYFCSNYSLTFTTSDFSEFGIIEGTIRGADETNPENPSYLGSFNLQIDEVE